MNDHLPSSAATDLLLFTAALDCTSNGVVITDHLQPDQPIIYCNAAFEKLTGYAKTEIIGRNCRFLQGEDRDQPAREILRKAVSAETNCQVELRNYRKDGTLFWNELIMSPVKNDQNKVTHFIGVQNDITRRKNAEAGLLDEKSNLENRVAERTADLADSEAYMASIVETIREGLIVLDGDLIILTVNDHFCRFFQLSALELVGKRLTDIPEWNIPKLVHLLKSILPHNNPFEGFELDAHFPLLGRKLLLLNARQITLEGKYQDRILLALEDITERREIEQRKEDFISIASHEMKTPLTSIKGNVQLMQRKAARNHDTTYDDSLISTVKSIERLDKLITDLLDVAKIQSGRIEFSFKPFPFDELVAAAIEGVQATVPDNRIEVNGHTNVNLTGDFARLEQVLINLLTNAIKYSGKEATVRVYVSVVAGFVKVAVADQGLGIHPRDHKRIFERFYRAGNVQERYPGIGIGLYICSQIIQAHKGSLWVESEEGNGSVFNFTIPINPKNDAA